MGLLGDFAGAFATNIGNEMQQNEREQRAMALQEALERRRIARAQNIKTKTAVPVPVPYGNPVQRGPGNWEQPTKIERGALLNENTLELDRPASLEDGPYMPTTDPNALTPAQMETARQKELDRESRENAARIRGASRGGGSDRRRYTTVTNPDGSKSQFDEQSGELVRELPAKPGKRESQSDAKAVLEKLNAITEADSVSAVKDVMRANGINPDSMEVRNLALGSDGDYLTSIKAYAKEKLGGDGVKSEAPASNEESDAIDQARKAIAAGAPRDAVLARLRTKFPKASL